ncbi:MAG: hypothetical protein KAT28_00390 [Candidatus Aenigmarchaeota archaeon]|nr:hypothetical protein [Candidatus Aenigmarchaeota archaeon]
MKENCYITSLRTTHKDREKELTGPCGPCSFINLTKSKGSFEFEKKLSDMGRLKPFLVCYYISFLVWGKKFKKDFKVFTSSRKLTKKGFNLIIAYENKYENKYGGISKEKLKKFKEQAIKTHEKIDKRFSNKIKLLREPLQKLDKLLEQGYRVAVLTSSFYFDDDFNKKNPAPHWIVAFKKEKNKYWFCDSANGIISFTKKQLEKGWKINKKDGFSAQLVAYKEKE